MGNRDYDAIAMGGGTPREHCSGALGDGRLRLRSSSGSWSAARGRLGLRPVKDSASAGLSVRHGNEPHPTTTPSMRPIYCPHVLDMGDQLPATLGAVPSQAANEYAGRHHRHRYFFHERYAVQDAAFAAAGLTALDNR